MSIVVLDKEECPTCGQAVNWRQIPLTTSLVRCLFRIYQHCKQTGRHEFQRKEIDPILKTNGTWYANFGYWKWWATGAIYTPLHTTGKKAGKSKGRGWWGFNIDRMAEFFSGKTKVYSVVYSRYKSDKKEYIKDRLCYINEIPDIKEFLDGEYNEYTVQYRSTI